MSNEEEEVRGGRGEEEEDAILRWLRADIVCLICHLQVCAYYRERGKVRAECKVSVCKRKQGREAKSQTAAMPSPPSRSTECEDIKNI